MVVLRAIQCTQPTRFPQPRHAVPVFRQHASLLQPAQEVPKRRPQLGRRQRVQQIANLGITGNGRHLKQAPGIVVPVLQLHRPLVGQEGRRLSEEHTERTQGRISQRILAILSRAIVRQLAKRGIQHLQHVFERQWRGHRSRSDLIIALTLPHDVGAYLELLQCERIAACLRYLYSRHLH